MQRVDNNAEKKKGFLDTKKKSTTAVRIPLEAQGTTNFRVETHNQHMTSTAKTTIAIAIERYKCNR
jgi:hypothetical protein